MFLDYASALGADGSWSEEGWRTVSAPAMQPLLRANLQPALLERAVASIENVTDESISSIVRGAARDRCPRRTAFGGTSAIMADVKVARARIVSGKIVTRAKFPEGARLTLLMDDERSPIPVHADDEAAIVKGLAEIDAGKGIPLDKFLAKLRRY